MTSPADKLNDTKSQSAEGSADDDGVIDVEIVDPDPVSATDTKPYPALETHKPERGGVNALLLGAVVLLGTFIAGLFLGPVARDNLIDIGVLEAAPDALAGLTPGAIAGDVAALGTRLSAVENRLTVMTETMAVLGRSDLNTAPDAATVAALGDDVAQLSGALETLAKTQAEAGDSGARLAAMQTSLSATRSQLDAFDGRLKHFEAALAALQSGSLTASPRGRMLIALTSLKQALDAGRGYAADLDSLAQEVALLTPVQQVPLMEPLETLRAGAKGLLPYDQLVSQFDGVAAALSVAEARASGNFLSGLFTLRRTDARATGVDAALNKAERALLAQNLMASAAALKGLAGADEDPARGWIDTMEALARARAAFEALRAGLLAGEASPIKAPAS